jgi:primosomal protein N' (replication factor Y)
MRSGGGPDLGVSVADVLVPVAVNEAYSYSVPEGLELAAGDFVNIPLGPRRTWGVVWEVRQASGSNLKSIDSKLPLPPLRAPLRELIDWVSGWTMSPRGMVLRMAVRVAELAGPGPPRIGVRRSGPLPRRLTPARKKLLAVVEEGRIYSKADLAEAASCSTGVIDALIDEGTLEVVALPPEPVTAPCDPSYQTPRLEENQKEAVRLLKERVAEKKFSVTLLEGVTGSGKTEVYFEAIAAALAQGRQALVLMPEIALTAQFLDRFETRFGARPAEWHSSVSQRKRARIWSAVASGEVQAVIGARSALFLPFADLALIVVDEEHDPAYKQEDGVNYHARDMAVIRGRFEKAAVILVSATPSIETRVNAGQGRYGHVRLDGRVAGRTLPQLELINLRTNGPSRGQWIAPKLAAAMAEVLRRGEQVLLFLNRRGYAPLTLCRKCGHRFTCPNCSAWLVEHRFRRVLMCHHCGHTETKPEACPSCEAMQSLVACGPGIERLAEEATRLFPDARSLVLSSDFPGGTERLRAEFEAVARGNCDIVIGTQLVAKGHNFPLLSLVGVIDADIGLSSGDFRAAERTFQLLRQVTGRAGRFKTGGLGLIQTWQPDHPVMQALVSGNSDRFYEEEIGQRLKAGLPPFGRLAALIVSGKDEAATQTHARALARAAYELPASPGWRLAPAGASLGANEISLLGPAEAPIAVLRGRHRFRLLVRAPRSADLQGFLRAMLAAGPKERGGIRVEVDIDPQSFL